MEELRGLCGQGVHSAMNIRSPINDIYIFGLEMSAPPVFNEVLFKSLTPQLLLSGNMFGTLGSRGGRSYIDSRLQFVLPIAMH